MIENPNNNPAPDKPTFVPPRSPQAAYDRLKFWKRMLRPKEDQSLETTLKPILSIYERSFGPAQTHTWDDNAHRARTIILLLRAIKRETFEEAHARRAQEPLAQSFLTQVEQDLRQAAPLLDIPEKAGLFRCGFPLGTGPDSLTDLYIHDELARRGENGVIDLFSQCLTYQAPVSPWTEELLRAATHALRDPSPETLQKYVLGLSLTFTPSSPFVSRVHELLEGMAGSVPLTTLITAYGRLRPNKDVAVELKRALLSEILEAIDTTTGKRLTNELLALKNPALLPNVTTKAVPLVETIAQSGEHADSFSAPDTTALKRLIEKWLRQAPTPDQATSPTYRPKRLKHFGSMPPVQPTLSQGENGLEEMQSPRALIKELTSLSREKLSAYLSELVDKGLRDPSSELSQEFSHHLNGAPITKLLVMRHCIASCDNIPDLHKEKIERRIQEELSLEVPRLNSEKLTYVYHLCLQSDAPQHEVTLVRNALRASLRLPPLKEETIHQDLSQPGRRVWQWIFSDLPEDRDLLQDLVRARVSTLMAHVARTVSLEVKQGPILDALIDYADEVGALKSYKPSPALAEVPLWKLICFTAHLRQELGEKHGIVSSMVEVLRTRLLTKDLERHETFPTNWRQLFNVKRIEEICAEIQLPITNLSRALSLQELTCLLNNTYFIGRRGPTQIALLRDYARVAFIEAFTTGEPHQFESLPQEAVRRSILSLAAARYRSLNLLNPLADECVRRADSLSAREFADIAIAFAEVRAGTPEFWSTFASHLEQNWASYSDNFLLPSVWGLCVAAPELVPARFNSSILHAHPLIFSINKVVQSLIALGRYTPQKTDRAYQYLLQSHSPFEEHRHERDFVRDLPGRIGVPARSMYPHVVVGGFETDVVVDLGSRRLIIELDGKSHFLEGPNGGILQGKDEFQDLVFRQLGYEVFHFTLSWKSRNHRYDKLTKVMENLRRETLNPEAPRREYCEELTPRN